MNIPLKPHALIGMIHLPALPGSPDYAGNIEEIAEFARSEAALLQEVGFDAVMIENFYDAPFYKDHLPAETVAALTRCALAAKEGAPKLPLGVNALRNDGCSALAIAVAVGASFIRVNVLCGAMVTDQGIIEGCAAELLRMRRNLNSNVAILADIDVKHAAPLAPLDPTQSAKDTVIRGRADALILSGTGTGAPTNPETVRRVKNDVPGTPLVIGSGITAENLHEYPADAFIVGTSIKENGRLSRARCEALRKRADELFA